MRTTKGAAVATAAVLAVLVAAPLGGCSAIESAINDMKGDLVGNGYVIETYDNYGQQTLETSGDKINMSGNKVKTSSFSSEGSFITNYELSSVITVTVDGHEIQTCGDTCIFAQTGLEKEMDFATPEFIESHTDGDLLDNTFFAYTINQYRNSFGKSRVVVIKSQMGQPLCAYSGDDVYWEVPNDLPKTTKLMIDGKALYIHRANFQIIDKELL